jgi:hypothetical protein
MRESYEEFKPESTCAGSGMLYATRDYILTRHPDWLHKWFHVMFGARTLPLKFG